MVFSSAWFKHGPQCMMSGNKELEIDSEIEYAPIINHQLELKNKTRITFIFFRENAPVS